MKFNKEIFERLAEQFAPNNSKISIFVPTDRVGDGQAAKIRFKNQLNEVVEKLMDATIQQEPMTKNEALGYTAKAFELLDNNEFWRYQSDGLVVFLDDKIFEHYTIPVNFNTFNYVGNVFYLRPTIPAISDTSRFFVLALSQNEIKFYEGAKHSITPVKIEDLVPTSLEESMAEVDIRYPAELQAHSGGSNPVFHGQGGEKDGKTDRIIDYFRMVDKGLMEMLHDEKAPLIIAAVDYLVPMYKDISNYSNIVEPHISGNVENDDPVLIHEKAWAALSPSLDKDFAGKKSDFSTMMANERASITVDQVAVAALNGRVDTLFLDKDAKVFWGVYHETDNTVVAQKKQGKTNTCLLNFAAVSTFLQSGNVYSVDRTEMPHPMSVVNASYRY
ncbi:MAG: hypothetical protein AAGJ18_15545 [Bacteroidota bacterium]